MDPDKTKQINSVNEHNPNKNTDHDKLDNQHPEEQKMKEY